MSWEARDVGRGDESAPARPPAAATPRVALLQQLSAEPARLLGDDGVERWADEWRHAAAELGLWEPRSWAAWRQLVTRGIVSE
jgi:hypothetical protein